MSKKSRIALIILIPVCIIFIIFSLILSSIYKNQSKPVELPKADLSDSLFVLQNNVYYPDEELPMVVSLSHVPYTVDMPRKDSINVGNGMIFALNEGFFSYVSEIPAGVVVDDVVKNEFSKALLADSIPEKCKCSILYAEEGYLNGFKETYVIYDLIAVNSFTSVEAFITGYLTELPDFDYDLFSGVSSPIYSTEALLLGKNFTDKIIGTIRLDNDREILLSSLQEDTMQKMDDYSELNETYKSNDKTTTTEAHEHPITLKKSYKSLNLELTWDNASANIVDIYMTDENKTYSYTPTYIGKGEALFELGAINGGNYIIIVKGNGYGDISLKLKDGH